MTDITPRLALPELSAAQAQKHVTVNEALVKLDALVDLYILGLYTTTPPASPADGDAYVTGGSSTGAWSGYDGKIASCIDGGWRFYTPFKGLCVFNAADGKRYFYTGSAWQAGIGPTTLAGYGIGDAAALDASGRLVLANQPVFTAFLSSAIGNFCGDGADHTIVFDATTVNRGSVYNTANGKFTAPVAGMYLFSGSALAMNLSSSNGIGWLMLKITKAAGGDLDVFSNGMNPYVCMRSDGFAGMILGSPVLSLSTGDTVEFQIHIGGSSNTVGLYGGALTSGLNTFFSGVLLAA
jgi:hypothetical protein